MTAHTPGRGRPLTALALVALAAVAGCDDPGGHAAPAIAANGVRQTQLPGHLSAGGRSSGAVIATTAGAPAQDMGPASREGGTPGIPQGAGGNTSGALMGGTTGTSALSNTGEQTTTQRSPGQGAPAHVADTHQPGPGTAVATASAASAAALAASAQQRLLDDRMALVARHWQQRAADQGWQVQTAPGQQTPTPSSGQAPPANTNPAPRASR